MRNSTIRNFFRSLLAYLGETVRTQHYTILNGPTPSLLYGHSWDGIPLLLPEVFAASSTPITLTITLALPELRSADSSSRECHRKLPPVREWHEIRYTGNYWYDKDGEWTGISVSKITGIPVLWARQPVKVVSLSHPVFRVSHYIRNKTFNIDCDLHIIDTTSLKRAMELAEWYYAEWEDVNSNGTVSRSVCRRSVST